MKTVLNKGLGVVNLKVIRTGRKSKGQIFNELDIMDDTLTHVNIVLAKAGIVIYSSIFIFCLSLL
jgi:hypothetical protein